MKRSLIYILFLYCSQVMAQNEIIGILDSVIISTSSIRNSCIGSNEIQINMDELPAFNSGDLTDLLQENANIFIKNYGPGSIASSSIRGANASQTLVLWNGIPITNPMLAQSDMSLLNMNGLERVSIQKGTSSSNWGSGAIAGLIQLENERVETSGLRSVSQSSAGSFGTFRTTQDLVIDNLNWQFNSNYTYTTAVNDYPYSSFNSITDQSHADYTIHQIKQNVYYNPLPGKQWSMHYWATLYDRNIPPLISQNESLAFQKDRSHRVSFQFKEIKQNKILKLNIAYLDESLDYMDPLQSIDSRSQFKSILTDLSIESGVFAKHSFLIGWNNNYSIIDASENYTGTVNSFRSSLFASLVMDWDRLRSKMGVRQEFNERTSTLPAMDIAFDLSLSEKILMKAKISKNYRLPGFNDINWVPGGNSELKAESGWSYETGIHIKQVNAISEHRFDLAYFSRRINNWILWIPNDQFSFWSAENINKVWSRGLEFNYDSELRLQALKIYSNIKLDYINSSNQVNLSIPKLNEGEQIWYSPKLKLYASLSVKYNRSRLSYIYTYTSGVRGFNEDIPGFGISGIRFECPLLDHAIPLTSFVRIENIFNKSYRIVEQRPMPGRSFELGMKLTIKNN